MSDTTTTLVFTIMTVSTAILIGLAYVIYKCRSTKRDAANPSENDSNVDISYRDDTMSEEDQLMIPLDREDTIDSLRQQLAQVNVANTRYIQIGVTERDFSVGGIEPRVYVEGENIVFRDIAIGFFEKISATKSKDYPELSQRESVIYTFCDRQLQCKSIADVEAIYAVIIYLCRIVIKAKYNTKKSGKMNVTMRDEQTEDFKSDLLPIVEWIWTEKMQQNPMDIKLFAQNMTLWIQEIESS